MEAERRQVTVLFADMVGFTSFAERSGEEAAFTLMRSLWRLMADSVREHGGVVQDFTGDGIMAVFGAPVAFEDGPLRASRAALSILQSLNASAPDLEARYGVRPHVRIGINTGPAVVGKVDDQFCGSFAVDRRAELSFHQRGDASARARTSRRELCRRTNYQGKI